MSAALPTENAANISEKYRLSYFMEEIVAIFPTEETFLERGGAIAGKSRTPPPPLNTTVYYT
jgi:hypothetical protein